MKITLKRELLERKLKMASSVLNEKSLIPIHKEGLVTFRKDNICFKSASDGLSMECEMPIESIEGEKLPFVCDLNLILGTISTLKAEEIILIVSKTDVQVKTTRTRSKWSIPINYQAEDYPKTNSEWKDEYLELPGSTFAEAIKTCGNLVDPKSIQLQFAGINMRFEGKSLYFESSRDQGICQCQFNLLEPIPFKGNILIPKSIVSVIDSYSKSQKVKIFIDNDERNVKIYDGASTAEIRLIEAQAAQIQMIIDAKVDPENYMIMNRMDVINTFKRIIQFSIQNLDPIVGIDMTEDETVNFAFNDPAYRKSIDEFIAVESKSPLMNFVTGINPRMFSESLQLLSGENIALHQMAPSDPFYVRDEDEGVLKVRFLFSASTFNRGKK